MALSTIFEITPQGLNIHFSFFVPALLRGRIIKDNETLEKSILACGNKHYLVSTCQDMK